MIQESVLRVGVDSRPAELGAKRASSAIDEVKDSALGAEKKFEDLTKASGILRAAFTTLIAVGVAKFFSDIVTAAGSFETKMAEISTLVDTATFKVNQLEAALKDQAVQFGQAPVQQAAAAYQIISAGASTATEAVEILTAANKLAIGGVTDVATAADGLTSVLNAYGDKVEGVAAVSDALFVGMKAGKTTIGELSVSLGKVAPLAAQANVSFDELVAATAALTKGGISTRESVTGVRAILAAVVKPTKEAADTAQALGLEFSAAALESKGFAAFLEDVVTKTGGSSKTLAKLFGGVEALIPAMALAGQAGEDFTSIMEAMAEKGGATKEAFDKITNTFEFQAARVREALNVALINLGSIITKALTPALKLLADNFDAITRFATTFAVGITTLMIPSILAMIPAAASATAAFAAMAAAFLATPFGAAVGVVTALSAAVAYFGDTTIEVAGKQVTVWETIKAAISVAWDVLKEGIGLARGVASKVGGFFARLFSKVTQKMGDLGINWTEALDFIKSALKKAINVYIGLWVGLISAIRPAIVEGIPAVFNLALGIVKNAVIDAVEFIVNTFAKGIGAAGDALSYLPGIADDLGDSIRASLSVDLTKLKSDTDALREKVSEAGGAIKDAFSGAQVDYVGAFGDAVSGVIQGLKDRFIAKLKESKDATEGVQKSVKDLSTTTSRLRLPDEKPGLTSLKQYAAATKDLARQIDDLLTSAFNNAEDALVAFVTTGKATFSDLVNSILADLARLAVRRFITGPLSDRLASVFDSISASVFHAGGIVGAGGPTRMIPAMAFATAPRMHSGGFAGLRADEVPAILQRGERVLSRRETQNYDAGVNVTVNINTRDAESFRQSRTQVAADIARAVSLGRRGL